MDISEAWDVFSAELERCRKLREYALDSEDIAEEHKELIYESILTRAFRSFENLVETSFFAFIGGVPQLDGTPVLSYLQPRDGSHARQLVLAAAGGKYLDWADAATVRDRCKIFLHSDNPISTALSSPAALVWMRKTRNHVAHNSVESGIQFDSVTESVLQIQPPVRPIVGAFLQRIPTAGPVRKREILAYFLESVESVARNIVRSTPQIS